MPGTPPPNAPNVLVLSWHDTGRYFGCYGAETVHSPNIDRLAADGFLFEDCFAASTVCSPSRGALLTGQYPQSNGLRGLCHGLFPWQFDDPHDHLSHLLRVRGWHTALAGFQHEVRHSDIQRLGFRELIEIHGRDGCHQAPCNYVADGAIEFLRRQKKADEPFYLQVGFFETHRPYDWGGAQPDSEGGVAVPPQLVDNDAARTDMAALQGALRKADHHAGRIFDALGSTGLADNTIVLFTTDHGLAVPCSKGTLTDAGMSVAFILRWPGGGIRGGKRSSRMVSNIDFVPTLFELLDLDPLPEFDGYTFADELGDWHGTEPRGTIHAMLVDTMRATRTQTRKLVYNYVDYAEYERPVDLNWIPADDPATPLNERRATHIPHSQPVPRVEFYDLENDPEEMTNVAGQPEYRGEFDQLAAEIQRWMERTGDPLASQPAPRMPVRRSNHFDRSDHLYLSQTTVIHGRPSRRIEAFLEYESC